VAPFALSPFRRFLAPAGRLQTSDDGQRRPGAHVSRLWSVAAARLEPGRGKGGRQWI